MLRREELEELEGSEGDARRLLGSRQMKDLKDIESSTIELTRRLLSNGLRSDAAWLLEAWHKVAPPEERAYLRKNVLALVQQSV